MNLINLNKKQKWYLLMKFKDLNLGENLLNALNDINYQETTPIQEQTIPEALSGKDILGIAQTGTGKTAAFCLPIIERMLKGRTRARMPRSLIIEPTRELALQVMENLNQFTKYHKFSIALLIGGTAFSEQEKKLDQGVDILIATPGRLLDHFTRGKLLLSNVECLVIDEADRMLDMGFIPDIEQIFKLTANQKQTLFFSATMPAAIEKLTSNFLKNPIKIEVTKPATTSKNINQACLYVPVNTHKAKRIALRFLIDHEAKSIQNSIIFCNRKKDVDIVYASLLKHGYSSALLHGNMQQTERIKTLDSFRSGKIKFLVASDIAARGLDIIHVSHIFNYDPPVNAEDYVHRIGRTGRAGRSGSAYTILTDTNLKTWKNIENLINTKIEKINNKSLKNIINKELNQTSTHKKIIKEKKDSVSLNESQKIIGFGNHTPDFMLSSQ